jgi:hypothetical protein
MDNQEAKFILNAYRPGGEDANDARFADALEQARRDPELERWFRESVAFDAAVVQKFREVTLPTDLRQSILAGVKVSRPSRWRNSLLKCGIAAAFLFAAIAGSLMLREITKPRLAGWQNKALNIVSLLVSNSSSFDVQSRNPAELMSWLRANDAPAIQTLPYNLDKLESVGCKTFSWNGAPVSVICFMRLDRGLIHLVATRGSVTRISASNLDVNFVQHGKWATATWREGDKVYMLALEGSRDQLRSYLL